MPETLESPARRPWHAETGEQVLHLLGSSSGGLSTAEASRRLAVNGPNELTEARPVTPLQIFLRQFKSVIIWVLIAAGLVSAALGEIVDAAAILAIVVLNSVIGFYQEFSAERAIASLKRMTAPQAKVLRDGKITQLPARTVVQGDVIEVEAGDLIAADARLLEGASLRCVESALTGESEAVAKDPAILPPSDVPLGDRSDMVFMGTSVASGRGRAVVVATAMNTELGHIAGLIEQAGEDEGTPLQRKLASFGRVLVWATLGIVAVLFLLGLVRGTQPFELFLTAVSLAVAAVPEGLPAVVTVAMALGVLRMSRRRALIRSLPAAETLGATTVICTDKTGTLTMGEMTVRALFVAGARYQVTGEGYGPEGRVQPERGDATPLDGAALRELATVVLATNNAHVTNDEGRWSVVGDPTEGALLAAAQKIGRCSEELEREMPRRYEFPFDSDRKRSTVVRGAPDGSLRAFVTGAPDVLLQRSTRIVSAGGVVRMSEDDRLRIDEENAAMADKALRVIAAAYRDVAGPGPGGFTHEEVEQDLVFVGLLGMYDPPRPEAKDAVARCRAAGIRVVMITGDHPKTATAVARELGIVSGDEGVTAGRELEAMDEVELAERARSTAVYARVTAEHKLRIVRAWKANGAVVAMTGDGINDAPAIKGADIGIAMGRSGTEVTKQASDMIITDDNFASIVAAVEEGRGIYDNIRKTLNYLLAGNTGELFFMAACIGTGLPIPLLPIHLLWINLVTDGLPALCLATDPVDPDVMKRQPRAASERLTDGRFIGTLLVTGVLTAGVAFAVFLYALRTESTEMARTHAFAVLVFAELLRSFGARSETKPFWRVSLLTNLQLTAVVAASFSLQVWSHHNDTLGRILKTQPVPLNECLMLLAVGAVPLVVLEVLKLASQTSRRRRGAASHASRLGQSR
jgi:Ca2+-transporting ATPase